MKPLVSVWMVTYNHEAFIRKALDSVLCQNVNFTYEIVIGEDCSPDNTRAILKEYQALHPELIKPIYHEKNVGATRNAYEFTLPKCEGKYIAILEGDDYWTDPNKLQKQVDFLEANESYSACGHQAEVIYEDGSQDPKPFGANVDMTYVLKDFMGHRKFHTSSLMYRHHILTDAGPFPIDIISADRAIYAMLSTYGPIKYFAQSMCIYRKSSIGLSNKITAQDLKRDLKMIPWLKAVDGSFPYIRYRSFLHLCIYTYPAKVSYPVRIKHFALFALFSFSYFPKNLGDIKHGISQLFRANR